MPKLTIEFTLPEEQEEAETAQKGAAYYSVLWEMEQEFRSRLKHGDESPERVKVLEEMRVFLYQALEERGLDLYRDC